jgi:DNA-binding NarL/FixJ family response regulator
MRVLLASGAGLYADALAHWLQALSSDIRLVRCGTSPTLLPGRRSAPWLALINMDDVPDSRALGVISDFHARFPKTRLVAMGTPRTKTFAAKAIKAGADAYLPKSLDETKAVALLENVAGIKLRRPGATIAESNRSSRKGAKAELLDAIRALQLQRAESEPALLDYLVPHMSHQRYRKGHVLFRKGEPGNAMYYVQRGRVRLPEIGASMSDGEIFGELGIFSPSHARTSSALCEVDTDLFVLTADQTRRLCFENPQFAYYVIRLIADRLVGERTRKWGQTPMALP